MSQDSSKHEKVLRAMQKLPANKRCFNCESLGTQYVVPQLTTFVCTECSGKHMNAGQRVKSISMGKFTNEEMAALEAGGNEVAAAKYLARWKPEGDARKPVDKNPQKIDAWIRTVFIDKRYYNEAGVPGLLGPGKDADQIPMKPLSDVLGANVRLQVSSQAQAPPAAPLAQPSLWAQPTTAAPAAAPGTAHPAQHARSLMDDLFGAPSSAVAPTAAPAAATAHVPSAQAHHFDPFAQIAPVHAAAGTSHVQAVAVQAAAVHHHSQYHASAAPAVVSAPAPALPPRTAPAPGPSGFTDDADWGAFSSAAAPPPTHPPHPATTGSSTAHAHAHMPTAGSQPGAVAPAVPAPAAAPPKPKPAPRAELPSDLFVEPVMAPPGYGGATMPSAGMPAHGMYGGVAPPMAHSMMPAAAHPGARPGMPSMAGLHVSAEPGQQPAGVPQIVHHASSAYGVAPPPAYQLPRPAAAPAAAPAAVMPQAVQQQAFGFAGMAAALPHSQPPAGNGNPFL